MFGELDLIVHDPIDRPHLLGPEWNSNGWYMYSGLRNTRASQTNHCITEDSCLTFNINIKYAGASNLQYQFPGFRTSD